MRTTSRTLRTQRGELRHRPAVPRPRSAFMTRHHGHPPPHLDRSRAPVATYRSTSTPHASGGCEGKRASSKVPNNALPKPSMSRCGKRGKRVETLSLAFFGPYNCTVYMLVRLQISGPTISCSSCSAAKRCFPGRQDWATIDLCSLSSWGDLVGARVSSKAADTEPRSNNPFVKKRAKTCRQHPQPWDPDRSHGSDETRRDGLFVSLSVPESDSGYRAPTG